MNECSVIFISHIFQIAILVSSKLEILKNVVVGHSPIGMTCHIAAYKNMQVWLKVII
jgi:hypothetical protein